jgi:hypothetical protein
MAVVVEIDALRLAAAPIPTEDEPPLAVDPDRVKPRQIAAQLLEVIAGRHLQVLIGRRVVCHLEPAKQPAFDVRQFPEAAIMGYRRYS